jgi:transposase
MKKILKQVVGIDVAQNELVVSLGRMNEDLFSELYAAKSFSNNLKGFESLQLWVGKMMDQESPVRYVMEATGIYHEKLAYYLSENGCTITIVLPNKISNYMRTLEVKTITDKTASQAITLFGLERKLDDWNRPEPVYKKLRQLTRERDQLIQERTVVKNQLHAEQSEAEPSKSSIKRMTDRIALINKQEQQIKAEIQEILKQNEEVKAIVSRLCSLTGVGVLTVTTVLGETNCFDLIRNKRQLASYAGFDVKHKESGTSIKGKPRISKKGNKYLRKAMYMPAWAAIRHDERFKAIYARLIARHGLKMKAAVAIQRKLLEMMYTLYKNNTTYDQNYLNKKIESNETLLPIQAGI